MRTRTVFELHTNGLTLNLKLNTSQRQITVSNTLSKTGLADMSLEQMSMLLQNYTQAPRELTLILILVLEWCIYQNYVLTG